MIAASVKRAVFISSSVCSLPHWPQLSVEVRAHFAHARRCFPELSAPQVS